MERQVLERQNQVLHKLSRLPRLMTHIHGRDNISQFLLHELCSEPCFNLRKAAYFVDNPDFNCLRGIAGFSRDQAYPHQNAIWNDPEGFSTHMERSTFNNKVRSMSHQSINQANDKSLLHDLASNLELQQFSNCSWNMRHDNFGLLMYEKADPKDAVTDEYLLDGMSLLSFCPIF
jgi:hypothetical protein